MTQGKIPRAEYPGCSRDDCVGYNQQIPEVMIGSIFFRHPEILLHSLSQMNDGYAGKVAGRSSGLMVLLQKLYIRLFGIPEIGFQVRSMYFRRAVREISQNVTPKKILDVGSGIGSYVFELAHLFPEASVDGWEIDPRKLSFTKKFAKELKVSNVSFSFGDITKKPKVKAEYDVVLTVDVLEHIGEYKTALANMYQVLKPGGLLYIHTPAEHQKRFFRSFESWEHEDHVREGFDAATLAQDLKKLGFSDVRVTRTFGFFGSLAWEVNHLLLQKSFVLAGFLYPLLYVISRLDGMIINKKGLCVSVIARKKNRV